MAYMFGWTDSNRWISALMAAELDKTNCDPAGPDWAAWPETVPEPNWPAPELADDPDPNWDGMDWGTGTGTGAGTVPGVGMAG